VLDKEMCQPLENVCNSVNQFLKWAMHDVR
jgi:hypothetical protein